MSIKVFCAYRLENFVTRIYPRTNLTNSLLFQWVVKAKPPDGSELNKSKLIGKVGTGVRTRKFIVRNLRANF
jgi:hypothetical protein